MTRLPGFANRDRTFGAVLLVVCGIVQAASLAVAAFATRSAFAVLHEGVALPLGTVLALSGSGLLAAVCLFVSRRQAEGLGQSYAIAMRRTLYAKIARLPKARHEQRRVGALSLRFVGDLSAARLWFGRGLPDILIAGVVLPGAVAILFALDPQLARAGLGPLALAMLLMVGLAWHLQRRHRNLRKHRANIAIAMIERIAIAPDLDLMGRTRRELRALDGQGETLRKDAVARRGRTAGLQAILQAGVAISGLTMLWVGAQNGTAPASVAASLSVLALVALPLQDLGAAWDKFCAWSIAREKALRLLAEPEVKRPKPKSTGAPPVELRGEIDGHQINVTAPAEGITTLPAPQGAALARVVAGLDRPAKLSVSFGANRAAPSIAFIGDNHIGLQGSLRRSATLSARKRPDDTHVIDVMEAVGLGALLKADKGLDQRLSENGKGLTAGQTLRIDLARAVLGEAQVIVISSLRFAAEPERERLLSLLQDLCSATIILADSSFEHPAQLGS